MARVAMISVCLVSMVLALAAHNGVLAEEIRGADIPVRTDVFTVSSLPVTGAASEDGQDAFNIVVHELDAIARFTQALSKELSNQPEQAKAEVLQRLKRINRKQQLALQRSAEALALGVKLGIKGYPAVVFDAKWVVYGITDVQHAIRLYHRWQAEVMQ